MGFVYPGRLLVKTSRDKISKVTKEKSVTSENFKKEQEHCRSKGSRNMWRNVELDPSSRSLRRLGDGALTAKCEKIKLGHVRAAPGNYEILTKKMRSGAAYGVSADLSAYLTSSDMLHATLTRVSSLKTPYPPSRSMSPSRVKGAALDLVIRTENICGSVLGLYSATSPACADSVKSVSLSRTHLDLVKHVLGRILRGRHPMFRGPSGQSLVFVGHMLLALEDERTPPLTTRDVSLLKSQCRLGWPLSALLLSPASTEAEQSELPNPRYDDVSRRFRAKAFWVQPWIHKAARSSRSTMAQK
uniref:Ras-associating domain-containing protein n=1 Tax=Steinernema glaseri TaxID=37863 RepID=A0A1I8ACW2_9BILA